MTPKTMAVVAKQAIKYQFGVEVYLSWIGKKNPNVCLYGSSIEGMYAYAFANVSVSV